MKRFAMALLLGAFATTALAADARYFVVTDTVGNCSVVDSKPGQSSGLKIVGDKGGYSSSDAASKVLKDMTKKCKGVVELTNVPLRRFRTGLLPGTKTILEALRWAS